MRLVSIFAGFSWTGLNPDGDFYDDEQTGKEERQT